MVVGVVFLLLPMLIKVDAADGSALIGLRLFSHLPASASTAPRSSALTDSPKASLIGRVSAANARHVIDAAMMELSTSSSVGFSEFILPTAAPD